MTTLRHVQALARALGITVTSDSGSGEYRVAYNPHRQDRRTPWGDRVALAEASASYATDLDSALGDAEALAVANDACLTIIASLGSGQTEPCPYGHPIIVEAWDEAVATSWRDRTAWWDDIQIQAPTAGIIFDPPPEPEPEPEPLGAGIRVEIRRCAGDAAVTYVVTVGGVLAAPTSYHSEYEAGWGLLAALAEAEARLAEGHTDVALVVWAPAEAAD